MRADRLVAALLILQAKGRVTAAELAERLEVSERTARRDLEALAMAGMPVYSQQGRGGGWSLIGGARTDLSGLTAEEARMLFMVAGPASAATPELRAALRKLVRALPEPFRARAEAAAAAVVLDPSSWDRPAPPSPQFLDVLQQAVVDGVQVRLGYAGRDKPHSDRTVHPLGLVAKGGIWYLVARTDAGPRTFRLSRVRSVELTDDRVERPPGFDLARTWTSIVASIDERRTPFRATAWASPEAVPWLRSLLGSRITVGDTAPDGSVIVEIRSWSAHTLAAEIAHFGTKVEVISPVEVRRELARLAAELTACYGSEEMAAAAVAAQSPTRGRTLERPGP
jgi:predicted DNA-binding transcriptional regulator YafY